MTDFWAKTSRLDEAVAFGLLADRRDEWLAREDTLDGVVDFECWYGGARSGDTPNMEGAQHTGIEALAMDEAYDEVEAATKLRAGTSLVVTL